MPPKLLSQVLPLYGLQQHALQLFDFRGRRNRRETGGRVDESRVDLRRNGDVGKEGNVRIEQIAMSDLKLQS